MNKMFGLKLILLFSLIYFASCQLCNTTYGLEGDACSPNENAKQSCILALTCQNVPGGWNCASVYEGKLCTQDGDCFDPFPTCIGGGCSRLKFPGDSCDENEDCDSGSCSNSVCAGIGERLPCRFNSRALCSFGLFCNKQSKCQAQLAEGEQCDGTAGGIAIGGNLNNLPLSCQPGTYCDVAQQRCLRFHSQGVGKVCSTDLVCETGLRCNNGECRNPATNPGVTICQGDFACVDAVCDCPTSAIGNCKTTYLNYECNQTSYTSCLEKNKCYHTQYAPFANGTCSNTFCKCEYIRYLRCLYKQTPNNMLGGRSAFPEDPTCATAASFSKNIVLIVVLGFISLLL